MTDPAYPTAATYPLPEGALRSPLRPPEREASGEGRTSPLPDESALCEALTPLISTAIARRARQRRYTP